MTSKTLSSSTNKKSFSDKYAEEYENLRKIYPALPRLQDSMIKLLAEGREKDLIEKQSNVYMASTFSALFSLGTIPSLIVFGWKLVSDIRPEIEKLLLDQSDSISTNIEAIFSLGFVSFGILLYGFFTGVFHHSIEYSSLMHLKQKS